MDEKVFPDPQVKDLINRYYVPVRIDESVDTGPFQKYNVISLPTMIILDSDGTEVSRSGYLDVEGMKAWLQSVAEKK